MDKANDEKFIKYLLTIIVAGLFLLIFSGLRSVFSYIVFAGMIMAFLSEVVKAVFAGFKIE